MQEPTFRLTSRSDVVGKQSDLDLYVYDRSNQEAFLGHVRMSPSFNENGKVAKGWFKLEGRGSDEELITGEIHLELRFLPKSDKKPIGPEDFHILKLIGKGRSKFPRSCSTLNLTAARHFRTSIPSQKERYAKDLRNESFVEKGYRPEERGRSHLRRTQHPCSNCNDRISLHCRP